MNEIEANIQPVKREHWILNRNKGFTLIELLVIIAIIGVLAAILVPAIVGYVKHSSDETVAIIEMDTNEKQTIEVDYYTENNGVFTIYDKEGNKYIVHSSKVIIQQTKEHTNV